MLSKSIIAAVAVFLAVSDASTAGNGAAPQLPPFAQRGLPGPAQKALQPLVGDWQVEKSLYIAGGTKTVERAVARGKSVAAMIVTPKPPTLAEIARFAGVSTATVTRVLKSRGYVAEETRARVAAVLRDTRYRPNVMASSLRTQQSFSIGLIVPAITSNPFFVNVAHAVEEEALKHGYKTIIFNHSGDEALERQGIERLLERRMDALLVCNATAAPNVELALGAGVAVVQIERETSARTMAVIADNYRGAREAMAHLLGLGHRRIAFLGGDPAKLPYHGPQAMSVEEQRLAAYREALEEAGIQLRPDYVRLGPYYDIPAGSGRYGRDHMQALLQLDERPTAIFATCDVLAAGVLQALHSARLHVPDAISVIGFDDTLAGNLTPALTTVAQPMHDMGAEAFRLAMAVIGGEVEPRTVTMPTWVVHRASTGPVGEIG